MVRALAGIRGCARRICALRRLLGRDHAAEHPPRLKLRGVGGDVDQAVERAVDAVGLHRLEEIHVLQERRARALVQQLRHLCVAER